MKTLALIFCFLVNLEALDLSSLARPDAPLSDRRRVEIHKQWLALTVGSYETNGNKGTWDADLLRLLGHVAAVQASAKSDLSAADAVSLSQRLVLPGACEDPLAVWAAWILTTNRHERWGAARRTLLAFDRDAAARPAATRHPRILEAIAAAELLDGCGREPKDTQRQLAMDFTRRLADSIGAAIRRDECALFPPVLIREIKEIRLNHQDFGEPVRKAIDDAVAAAKPAPWIGNVMMGSIRISNAWAWRGSDAARAVTDVGWIGFHRNLAEADALLTASWLANPHDPLAAAYACTVAGVGSSATPLETWLVRSMQACFDHDTAFLATLNFMLPRWGGSYPQMLALGCDCLDTRRFDTFVPWRVLTAATWVISDAKQMQADDDMRAALADARVAAAVDACVDGYIAVDPTLARRLQCTRAAIHWWGGRTDAARAALAGFSDADLDADVARSCRVDLRMIRGPLTLP